MSCDVERTRAQTDTSGAPGRDRDDEKRPMKLRITSGRVNERSKAKGREDSPIAGRVEQNDPGGKADASGTPEDDEDDLDMPTKLRTMSECVSESSKTKGRKYLPGRTKVEPGDPGCEADASAAPWSIKRVLKKPKKLSNTSERERKRSKRRSRQHSPGRPGEEPDEPGGETVVQGDVQSPPERHRGGTNDNGIETKPSSPDTEP